MADKKSMAELGEVAARIKEMREIMGYSESEMAQKTEVSAREYLQFERGQTDMPFTFIYKCALAFGIGITDLLEGHTARLTSYTVTRKSEGIDTAREDGILIQNLAPKFRDKIAQPYWVKYEYSEAQQNAPIHTVSHKGQEFDLVLSGTLLVQVGENKELLHEGDSIYYDSATPHGMIAVDGKDCVFLAVVLPGESKRDEIIIENAGLTHPEAGLLVDEFVQCTENEGGALEKIEFKNTERYNFGFDTVDAIALKYPEKLAMIHLDKNKTERRFTFADIRHESNRAANYFTSLGIKKGDKVMLVLKRHYQFWFAMVALHKIGAVAIPATYQLKEHDFVYRFDSAGVSTILCTADGDVSDMADAAAMQCPTVKTKILVGGQKDGWHDFDSEYKIFSSHYQRSSDTPCG